MFEMMHSARGRRLIRLSSWVLLCQLATTFLSADEDWGQRLRKEYDSAIAPVVAMHHQISISGTRSATGVDGALEVVGVEHFKATAGRFLTSRSAKAEGPRLFVINPEGSFFAKGASANQMALTEYATAGEQFGQQELTKRVRLNGNPIFAPYCFYEQAISEILSDSKFSVTRVESIEGEAGSLAKIHWTYPAPQVNRTGYFVFDPSDHWVLRDWSLTLLDLNGGVIDTRNTQIDYTRSETQLPLVHSVVHTTVGPSGGGEKVAQFVVDKASLEPVDLKEFTPEAYGMRFPASVQGAASSVPRSRWLMLGNALLLLAIGAFVGGRYLRAVPK